MIDWEDVDFAVWAGPAGLFGLVLILVLAYFACQNDTRCSEMHCTKGQKPKLMAHSCLCVEEAQP